jgi:hypothetical protein
MSVFDNVSQESPPEAKYGGPWKARRLSKEGQPAFAVFAWWSERTADIGLILRGGDVSRRALVFA